MLSFPGEAMLAFKALANRRDWYLMHQPTGDWYLMHQPAANAQTSLCISAVSPEHVLIAFARYWIIGRIRPQPLLYTSACTLRRLLYIHCIRYVPKSCDPVNLYCIVYGLVTRKACLKILRPGKASKGTSGFCDQVRRVKGTSGFCDQVRQVKGSSGFATR